MRKKLLSMAILTIALAVTIVSITSSKVYADGNGSPVACNSNPNINPDAANVLGSQGSNQDLVTVDVGAGKLVAGVCIKSGSNMFAGVSHSGVLGNGTYENDCYQVSGVGTQVVTVTRLFDANICQGISHIDVLLGTPGQGGGGGNGGGQVLGSTTAQPNQPQAQAPTGGVMAGGGAVIASLAGLLGSALTAGYGFARLRR